MAAALMAYHSYTGCDTTSAFSGLGKIKGLRLLTKNAAYVDAFTKLGSNWALTPDVFSVLEKFTCQLYCQNTSVEKVNVLRYQMFRGKKGSVDSGNLPPCEDRLYLHALRANYQAAIWKRSLEGFPDIPDPVDGHGWILDGEKLTIKWMAGAPAPEVVLELLSCDCSKKCEVSRCPCLQNNLKCTSACKLLQCNNSSKAQQEDVDSDTENYYSSGDQSEDDDFD